MGRILHLTIVTLTVALVACAFSAQEIDKTDSESSSGGANNNNHNDKVIKEEQKAILKRNDDIFDAINRLAFEEVVQLYTEDATLLPEGGPMINGRQAILASFKEVIPYIPMKAGKLVYFELINESTAYLNEHVIQEDEHGNIRGLWKDALLWKKINGLWYLHKDIYNSSPLPEKQIDE